MNILQFNNFHYIRGGAESYYFALSKLLDKYEHNVTFFSINNQNNLLTENSKYFGNELNFFDDQSIMKKIITAFRMIYSFNNNKKIENLINIFKFDLAHAHNIYGRISPSVLRVFKSYSIPVIMTLHDYKIGCSIYTFYNNGKICEDCLWGNKFSIIMNRCSKNSYIKSCIHFTEAIVHNILNIYKNNVSLFIAPSKFLLKKHIEIGIPENKLVHIPNFVDLKNFEPTYYNKGYVLYFGRISQEKGILTLIKSMKNVDANLLIVGEGPAKRIFEQYIRENNFNNIFFKGFQTGENLKKLIQDCAFVISPSEWYENNPMTIIESFAYGKPVIGSNIGGIPELIKDDETGYLFEPGNYYELQEKIKFLLTKSTTIIRLGRNARRFVEKEYSPDIHYKRILNVYNKVLLKFRMNFSSEIR